MNNVTNLIHPQISLPADSPDKTLMHLGSIKCLAFHAVILKAHKHLKLRVEKYASTFH